MNTTRTLALAVLLALAAAPAAAQQRSARFAEDADAAPVPSMLGDWRALRVAKWTTLAASIGAAAYGFSAQKEADTQYNRLERACAEDADRCRARLENGAFADAGLEAMYQEVLELDRSAKLGLIASQVGIAASVVLFILDLNEDATPPNVPFDPKGLRVVPQRDGGLELGWTLPFAPR